VATLHEPQVGTHRRTSPALAILVVALVAGLAAAAALATVTVYRNNFSGKAEARELQHVEGSSCDRSWREGAENLRIKVKKGPEACGYRPPVEGDSDQPDHDWQAKEKLLNDTPKGVRDGAYLAVAVRFGKDAGYELRVFPTTRKYELRRSPSGGGGSFPATGTDPAIKGINKVNVLRLKAKGATVTGLANGKQLAQVTDPNPSDVDGRKLEVAIGHTESSGKPVLAVLDDLALRVPNP
jgi:hypothetical protein